MQVLYQRGGYWEEGCFSCLQVIVYLENALVKPCKTDFMIKWSPGLSPNNHEQVFTHMNGWESIWKASGMDFPGGPRVGTSPSKAGSTLVRKLRSHMSCGQKTKMQNRSNIVTNSTKIFLKKRKARRMWDTSPFYFPLMEKVRIPDLCPPDCLQYGPIIVSTAPFLEDQNIKARHSYTDHTVTQEWTSYVLLFSFFFGRGIARKLEQFLWN